MDILNPNARTPPPGTRARLDRARLAGTEFTRRSMVETYMPRADLRGADLDGNPMDWADLRGAGIRGGTLTRSSVRGADLRAARVRETDLAGTDLSRAELEKGG